MLRDLRRRSLKRQGKGEDHTEEVLRPGCLGPLCLLTEEAKKRLEVLVNIDAHFLYPDHRGRRRGCKIPHDGDEAIAGRGDAERLERLDLCIDLVKTLNNR